MRPRSSVTWLGAGVRASSARGGRGAAATTCTAPSVAGDEAVRGPLGVVGALDAFDVLGAAFAPLGAGSAAAFAASTLSAGYSRAPRRHTATALSRCPARDQSSPRYSYVRAHTGGPARSLCCSSSVSSCRAASAVRPRNAGMR